MSKKKPTSAVRLAKTIDELTQGEYVKYIRAYNKRGPLPEDALVIEQQLAMVQAAADAGWLELGELGANVEAWPLTVSVDKLANEIVTLLNEARNPDPKA